MYVPLPVELVEHIFPTLYFPYFGCIRTAEHATFGINPGPPEAEFNSLATLNSGWDVAMSVRETDRLIRNPRLVDRSSYYFHHGQDGTPAGLGCPTPTGFWSFFNCAANPLNNPIHRSHYFDGTLVHLDAVPWATIKPWSKLEKDNPGVAMQLTELALPVFYETLRNAPNLRSIFVRGRTAAQFLEETELVELDFIPCPSDPRFRLAKGRMSLPDGRKIEVRAINHFQNISEAAAGALILL